MTNASSPDMRASPQARSQPLDADLTALAGVLYPVDQLSQQWRKPTFRDDLADFIDDLRAHPELACVCTAAGFVAGLMLTVGLACVIGLFL